MSSLHFQRNEDGAWTNLPCRYFDHAGGVDWSNESTAAADLALNILQHALEVRGYKDDYTVKVKTGGWVFALAYVLHQDFMKAVIAKLPYAGGSIPLEAVNHWIDNYPQNPPIGPNDR